MKQYVTIHFDASYSVEVEAATVEEAKELAMNAFHEADFGEADVCDGAEVFRIENSEGNCIY